MAIKLNLGSGFKRYEGFVNVDDDPGVKPDYVVNLDDVNIRLPFEDNSVDEIKASHILEHIGEGFIPLMKELYRIAEHGCIFDITVPHHQHEVFYGDVTHKRPITINAMYMFSKKFCEDHIKTHNSSPGMALRHKVDWEVIHFDYEYDQFYVPMIENYFARKSNGHTSPEEDFAIERLMREATNVAINTHIKMVAIKEY